MNKYLENCSYPFKLLENEYIYELAIAKKNG